MGKYPTAILALLIALSMGLGFGQEDDQQMQDQQAGQNDSANASISVNDQELTNNTLAISRAMIDKPGWIAIHNVQDGRLGGIVGFTRLDRGTRNNIKVPIDANMTTGNLVAELHYDMGTIGCFEFPGADIEVKENGQPVIAPFAVTIAQELQQRISERQQQLQQLIQQGPTQPMEVSPQMSDQNLTTGQNMTMEQNQTMDMGMNESQTEA